MATGQGAARQPGAPHALRPRMHHAAGHLPCRLAELCSLTHPLQAALQEVQRTYSELIRNFSRS